MLILSLLSCQTNEIATNISFNYDDIGKITISSREKKINNLYKSKYNSPYIDHSLPKPSVYFLNQWFKNNINTIGAENYFSMNIIESSLKKTEVENTSKKKYQEKKLFLFEINFIVEFILYDNLGIILSKTTVESSRSITSSKYVSINDVEKITKILIFNCLKDFSKKTDELMNIHFSEFIL